MAAIEIEGLHKHYSRPRRTPILALAGLDLSVPEGGVFGFLGPNGAGKTTTIRCLLGLVRPTSGRCKLLGSDTASVTELAQVLRRVGSVVETPALYPYFSGRVNLDLFGRLEGIGSRTVVNALERVGLMESADVLVKDYSLGMRQRLGLAAALLKDPEVLLLDEPANGLDPAGIRELRVLFRGLGDEGRTVFISSHILSEIQQTADRIAILSRGRCVTAGSVGEVLATGRSEGLVVRLDDLRAGAQVLTAAGLPTTVREDALFVSVPPSQAADVSRLLADQGLYPTELRPDEADLETVFLHLTDEERGAP